MILSDHPGPSPWQMVALMILFQQLWQMNVQELLVTMIPPQNAPKPFPFKFPKPLTNICPSTTEAEIQVSSFQTCWNPKNCASNDLSPCKKNNLHRQLLKHYFRRLRVINYTKSSRVDFLGSYKHLHNSTRRVRGLVMLLLPGGGGGVRWQSSSLSNVGQDGLASKTNSKQTKIERKGGEIVWWKALCWNFGSWKKIQLQQNIENKKPKGKHCWHTCGNLME